MITTWSQGDPDDALPESVITDLAHLMESHPWLRARARLVPALLARHRVPAPSRVLDVGCGWGVILDALEREGYEASGLDVSLRALERIDRPRRRLIQADITQPLPISGHFDAVLALDVIEHLDDDRACVERLAELVRPGGLLVVSVPGMPGLYSRYDEVSGHRRRYDVPEIRRAMAIPTVRVTSTFWWGEWTVPVLKLRRMRQEPVRTPEDFYRDHLAAPPWPLGALCDLLYRLEEPRALRGATLFGTSLFAVGVVGA